MARKSDYQYSVLIVSMAEQFNILAKHALPSGRFKSVEIKKSASLAERALLEQHFDLIIVNAPLSDQLGVDFALETAEKVSGNVILAVPSQICDDVAEKLIDFGVITLPKPIDQKSLSRAVRMSFAVQDKLRASTKKVITLEKKMEEIRLVNRAKIILVERGMTEEEAHNYIIKQAMDNGLTKRQVADEIIDG